MSGATEIDAGHALWSELPNGLLWHRTSTNGYRQIRNEGFIKPNDGRVNRWGSQYACQQLGGVSLFDFTTEPEDKVLGEAIKWQQFLGDVGQVTVFLGIQRNGLPGRLIRYPENKHGTTGAVIPWVEVCYCGTIPISAVVSHLLICAGDYRQFCKLEELTEEALIRAESEFSESVRLERLP